MLVASGAAALGWRRVRGTALDDTQAAADLRDAYRWTLLTNARDELDIQRVVSALRAAGIEPLLVKGWTNSLLYPEPGLRPFGDIDLCVDPDRYAEATSVIRGFSPTVPLGVDLHIGLLKNFRRVALDDQPFEQMLAAAEVRDLNGVEIRTPCPEDHLRLLCLHFLGLFHAGWRPIWLCDIAAAVEAAPRGFDWERVLRGGGRNAQLIAASLMLAERLLGAASGRTPLAAEEKALPGWVIDNVLTLWGRAGSPHIRTSPMRSHLNGSGGLLSAVAARWPSGLEATIHSQTRLNRLPRFPLQAGLFLWRASTFVARSRRGRATSVGAVGLQAPSSRGHRRGRYAVTRDAESEAPHPDQPPPPPKGRT